MLKNILLGVVGVVVIVGVGGVIIKSNSESISLTDEQVEIAKVDCPTLWAAVESDLDKDSLNKTEAQLATEIQKCPEIWDVIRKNSTSKQDKDDTEFFGPDRIKENLVKYNGIKMDIDVGVGTPGAAHMVGECHLGADENSSLDDSCKYKMTTQGTVFDMITVGVSEIYMKGDFGPGAGTGWLKIPSGSASQEYPTPDVNSIGNFLVDTSLEQLADRPCAPNSQTMCYAYRTTTEVSGEVNNVTTNTMLVSKTTQLPVGMTIETKDGPGTVMNFEFVNINAIQPPASYKTLGAGMF